MRKPIFSLIAGINGAGKTTLAWTMSQDRSLGERINIDEMVKDRGDWRDGKLQLMVSRDALEKMYDCIDKRVSFHTETTLPGNSIVKLIERAKANGFEVDLYYVGLQSVEIALDRVRRRVQGGGHGIDEDTIRKRYDMMIPRLKQILPMVDRATMFDNSVTFRTIAAIYENRLVNCDHHLPEWFIDLIDGIVVG